MNLLSKAHYDKYREWNAVAEIAHTKACSLVDNVVVASASHVVFSKKALVWIKSQILSAAMEAYYSDCCLIQFFQQQIDVYRAGHFPCGLYVTKPEDFIDKMVVVIY